MHACRVRYANRTRLMLTLPAKAKIPMSPFYTELSRDARLYHRRSIPPLNSLSSSGVAFLRWCAGASAVASSAFVCLITAWTPIVYSGRRSHLAVRETLQSVKITRLRAIERRSDTVLPKKRKAERSVIPAPSDNRVTTSGVRSVFLEPRGVPTEPICTHLDSTEPN
jgi:hypothetical protein